MANYNNEVTKLCEYFHPGEDLEEKLQEMGISITDFSTLSNLPESIVRDIIKGEASITADIAIALEYTTQIPAYMWLRAQHDYDEYIVSQKRKSTYITALQRLTRRAAAAVL